MLESWKAIVHGRTHNAVRRNLRKDIKGSIRTDGEKWWTGKVREMKAAKIAGNIQMIFQLIRATGPRGFTVSEIIKDRNGSLI